MVSFPSAHLLAVAGLVGRAYRVIAHPVGPFLL
jgi:hypothetical protein